MHVHSWYCILCVLFGPMNWKWEKRTLRIELSAAITFHKDFVLRHLCDTFLCVAQIWTEEARVKQRVANRFASLKVALKIRLSLRALELGTSKSWTKHYGYPQWRRLLPTILPSRILIFQMGRWLLYDFIVKFLRRLQFLGQGYSFAWQSLQGFDLEIRFSSSAMTLVLAVVHFRNCTHLNGYHFTVTVKCSDVAPDPLSISCYLMPIPVILHMMDCMMDAFGVGCCWCIQATVAWLTLSILLLV